MRTSEAGRAFQDLKVRFTSAPLLTWSLSSFCWWSGGLRCCDGCRSGSTACRWESSPNAFFSSWFLAAEKNYVGDWELLAMKMALEKWHHWLKGPQNPFLVWTGHKNLKYVQKAKHLNPRQASWALFFNNFDFVLSYPPGSKNQMPCPDHARGPMRSVPLWPSFHPSR